jgi:hypothetical protein
MEGENMRTILLSVFLGMLLLLSACSSPDVTDFESCVAAGNPIMESFPRQCSANGETFVEDIELDDKACTREYMPVCGKVQVQCITTPCDPITTTFPNRCEAERAGAFDIIEGACVDEEIDLGAACQSADATWLPEFMECEYLSKEQCTALGGTFNECASACRNDPEAVICTLQCVPVCSFA